MTEALLPMKIEPAELLLVLALVRDRTLPAAAAGLRQDPSTVFRAIRRLESKIGRPLFARSRKGFDPTPLALALAERAQRIEDEALSATQALNEDVDAISGAVKLTTTDVVLHTLLMPLLPALLSRYPKLRLEVDTESRLLNLRQKEADIALRPTDTPPGHMVGRVLRPIRQGVAIARALLDGGQRQPSLADYRWLIPSGPIAEHASSRWRQRHVGDVEEVRMTAMAAVVSGVYQGLGVAVIPDLAFDERKLVWLLPDIPSLRSGLWLLHHPGERLAPRIKAVTSFLSDCLRPQEGVSSPAKPARGAAQKRKKPN